MLKNAWINTKTNKPRDFIETQQKIRQAVTKLTPEGCPTNPDNIPYTEPNPLFDQPFSFDEFNYALQCRNKHSAPGLDGIDYTLLTRLSVQLKLILLNIFNDIHLTGEFPPEWMDTYLHFIPKANNSGVRPIALTSCILKLYESISKNRL